MYKNEKNKDIKGSEDSNLVSKIISRWVKSGSDHLLSDPGAVCAEERCELCGYTQGRVTVGMKKEDYLVKCNNLLKDEKTYVNLTRVQRQLCRCTTRFRESSDRYGAVQQWTNHLDSMGSQKSTRPTCH